MSRLSITIKETALKMRTKGYSLKEIAQKLHIAKSTVSLWTQGIQLNISAQKRLQQRKALGAYKTAQRLERKRRETETRYCSIAYELLKRTKYNKDYSKLYCALLYWCEGGKGRKDAVSFTNSDPSLIKTFLELLRRGFGVNEQKLRVLMHLHAYHNEEQQREFWTKITGIPKSQFHRTFQKPNTKKRIKENYPGCVRIAYYDMDVAKEIRAIYRAFSQQQAQQQGGVV